MSAIAGGATGLGSWPGTDSHEAARAVFGELSGRGTPFLPMLENRGPGSEALGRTTALLVDLPVEASSTGYRLSDHVGLIGRRAIDFLHRDVDAFEEVWEIGRYSHVPTVKIQVVGPVTLAARLELRNGHAVVDDRGAVRDLVASLAEGTARHIAEIERRLRCRVVVQWDEPSLREAMSGRAPAVSILQPSRSVTPREAATMLGQVVGLGEASVLNLGAGPITWDVISDVACDAVVVDLGRHTTAARDIDGLGAHLDRGRDVVIAAVPIERSGPSTTGDIVRDVRRVSSTTGFSPQTLLEHLSITHLHDVNDVATGRMVQALRAAVSAYSAVTEDFNT
ncbi:methionine synthase [Hoyosella rhizosphaerae]|uniref:Cobalamin-independent methionine synthase MetE C-terminal/archaeal domain-containing protein n=1 Tax=Hoyosella rhizosphaerae TaxID=1755582 RepID=A0A916U0S5_9ACTN|nr:methionine synthase [Hoyosella rhizosphaerae]MBN4927355.1 methionine synthase [Hoyosella rhizosphaerae]GGC51919.1 hypothetical protein GCM10011410_00280 [Hoyosella rhizosphaerae]